MNYTDLDLDHKREFLVNARVSMMACALACDYFDSDEFVIEIWRQAYDKISKMSDIEVERVVAELEKNRKPFNHPEGTFIAVEIFSQDDKL